VRVHEGGAPVPEARHYPHPSRCARHPLPQCRRGAKAKDSAPQSPSPALRERGDPARQGWMGEGRATARIRVGHYAPIRQ
jgi:hypothetical protein